MRRNNLLMLLSLMIIFFSGCSVNMDPQEDTPSQGSGRFGTTTRSAEAEDELPTVAAQSRVVDIINLPEFDEFGRFLFPTERGMPDSSMQLSAIGSLLPYHNHIDTDTTLDVINEMLRMEGTEIPSSMRFTVMKKRRLTRQKKIRGCFSSGEKRMHLLRSSAQGEAFPMSAPSMRVFRTHWN